MMFAFFFFFDVGPATSFSEYLDVNVSIIYLNPNLILKNYPQNLLLLQ